MPSVPHPNTLKNYLEPITGPDEQHEVGGGDHRHCVNPKCRAEFPPGAWNEAEWDNGWYVCPTCNFKQNLFGADPLVGTQIWKPGQGGEAAEFNPGGLTRFSLTPKEMGDIGETLGLRLADLPGVGHITSASDDYNHAIDLLAGPYGIEVKTTHSQATPIFKIGDKDERDGKLDYCLEKGLKPALMGVRLNFFTDLAYLFFRPDLIDTALTNPQFEHVGTLNFADLNPFKSPDPQARAMEIKNAELPESEDEEFTRHFGAITGAFEEEEHPRKEDGTFTFKKDVHNLPVHDHKGKHTHNIRRCKHCGDLQAVPAQHQGRFECESCGRDIDRKFTLAKIVIADPRYADQIAKQFGWEFAGPNANGERGYHWTDEDAIMHRATCGSGQHGKGAGEIDAQRLRQRMQSHMQGKCNCSALKGIEMGHRTGMPESPVFSIGETVTVGPNTFGLVMGIDGEYSLVRSYTTGETEYIPTRDLKAASYDRLGDIWQEETK